MPECRDRFSARSNIRVTVKGSDKGGQVVAGAPKVGGNEWHQRQCWIPASLHGFMSRDGGSSTHVPGVAIIASTRRNNGNIQPGGLTTPGLVGHIWPTAVCMCCTVLLDMCGGAYFRRDVVGHQITKSIMPCNYMATGLAVKGMGAINVPVARAYARGRIWCSP